MESKREWGKLILDLDNKANEIELLKEANKELIEALKTISKLASSPIKGTLTDHQITIYSIAEKTIKKHSQ